MGMGINCRWLSVDFPCSDFVLLARARVRVEIWWDVENIWFDRFFPSTASNSDPSNRSHLSGACFRIPGTSRSCRLKYIANDDDKWKIAKLRRWEDSSQFELDSGFFLPAADDMCDYRTEKRHSGTIIQRKRGERPRRNGTRRARHRFSVSSGDPIIY